MQKRQRILSAFLFLAVLLVFSAVTLLKPKKTVSETENRTLAERPHLSVASLLDKSFMADTDVYLADHFFARTELVQTKYTAEMLLGRKELGGVYITDDRLIAKTTDEEVNASNIDASLAAINTFASNTETPVAMLLAPTAAAVYANTLPDNAPNYDQNALLQHATDTLREHVTMINTFNALSSMRDEYIYYRTDHHWTSYGAYCAYQAAIKKLGFSPIAYDKYSVEHVSNSFRGTLYAKCLYSDIEPDFLDLYTYESGAKVTGVTVSDGIQETKHDGLYYREYLDTMSQYNVYLGQNTAMVKIQTDVRNDKKLLLFKDSYANSLIPFLTQHYSEIVVLDLRYIRGSYRDFAVPEDFSQVLLLYNAITFATDQNVRLLGVS